MTLTAPQKLALFPNGNPKPTERQQAEVLAAHERLKGRDPREMTVEDFASIGHTRRPFLAVIRDNCIHCQGGNAAEVLRCRATACVFYPYRMATNPLRAPLSAAQQAARREAGQKLARYRVETNTSPRIPAEDGLAGSGVAEEARSAAPPIAAEEPHHG